MEFDRQYNFEINCTGNIYYDISDRLTVEANAYYRNLVEFYQFSIHPTFSFSAGVSYTFLKDKSLTVEMSASNFVRDVQNYRVDWRYDNNLYRQDHYRIPAYTLKLPYRFQKGKEIKRRNNEGDFSRMMSK